MGDLDQWIADHQARAPLSWRASLWLPGILAAVGVLLAVVVLVWLVVMQHGAEPTSEIRS